MKIQYLIILLCLFIVPSCVSKAKYNDIEEQKQELDEKIRDLYEELSIKDEMILHLEDELRNTKIDMEFYHTKLVQAQNKMNDAYQAYHFWGPSHFFTQSAINELYQSVLY